MHRLRYSLLVLLALLLLTAGSAYAQQTKLDQPIEELADQLSFANEGEVKSVSGDSIYIDLGQQEGIREGMTFEVVRLGEPITSDGEIIGHQEEILGEAEVIRARKQISILEMVKSIAEGKSVKKGDKVYQKQKKVKRIAITEFAFSDKFNQLTKNIEDRLYTAMIQRGMDVVERDKLTQVLKEQKKEWSGLFDLSSAAKLGELLGVEAVLIGSVSDQGEQLSIRARLVDVETAQAIAAAATRVKETPNIADALKQGVRSEAVESMDQAVDQEETAEETGGTTQGVLFSDNFPSDELSAKWRVTEVGGSKLGVEKGELTIVGEKHEDQILKAFVGKETWRNYILSVDIRFHKCVDYGNDCPWDTWYNKVKLFVRARDRHNMVGFEIYNGAESVFNVQKYGVWKDWEEIKKENEDAIGKLPKQFSYHVVIVVRGDSVTAVVNGQTIAKLEGIPYETGFVGLQCALDWDKKVWFDNFEVTKIG